MPQIHHHDPVAEIAHDAEVVADKEQRGLMLALDLHQQIGDGRLHRHVERRDRFICHNDARIACKGAGDPHPLFLPARQLARHTVGKGAGQFHQIEQLQHPRAALALILADLENLKRPNDLPTHGHRRVQRVERVLEHHLNIRDRLGVAVFDGYVLNGVVAKGNRAFGCRLKAHQHLCKGGFAAPGFAHNGQCFGFAGLETEGLVGFDHLLFPGREQGGSRNLIIFLEVVHLQNNVAHLAFGLLLSDRYGRVPVDLLELQTARFVAGIVIGRKHRDGLVLVAQTVLEIVAAGAKVAAGRAFMGQGEVAGDRHQRGRILVSTGQGDRAKQGLCIRMLHLVKDLLDAAPFHSLAGVHHANPVAGFQNQAEVVRNKQHRSAVFLAQVFDQLDHRGLDRDIKSGGGLIQDQQGRLGHQRHGDHDPLLLTARKLVREAVQDPLGVRQFHIGDHLQGAGHCILLGHALVDHRHLGQLLADLHRRVQRSHRLLIDHGDLGAANVAQLFGAHLLQVAALELDGAADDAAVLAQILHNAEGNGGFATAALAYKTYGLTGLYRDRKIHHSRDFPQPREKGNAQLVDLKDRAVIIQFSHFILSLSEVRGNIVPCFSVLKKSRGSRGLAPGPTLHQSLRLSSRRPSASKFNPSTSVINEMAGGSRGWI
mmetsp:Transcript_18259/g.28909  ORF Transcript_18259/g.28909 Transcript_18259/m.28909 type:complete len:656 (+) Transcript_18259:1222-3189(+)